MVLAVNCDVGICDENVRKFSDNADFGETWIGYNDVDGERTCCEATVLVMVSGRGLCNTSNKSSSISFSNFFSSIVDDLS